LQGVQQLGAAGFDRRIEDLRQADVTFGKLGLEFVVLPFGLLELACQRLQSFL